MEMIKDKSFRWMIVGIISLILNWTIIGCGCIIYAIIISDDSDELIN